ncbi:MAG: hypothetical protein WCO56_17290 [Verrucomicrobiota bacterium]
MSILAVISEGALLTVIIAFCLFMVTAGIILMLAVRETLRDHPEKPPQPTPVTTHTTDANQAVD